MDSSSTPVAFRLFHVPYKVDGITYLADTGNLYTTSLYVINKKMIIGGGITLNGEGKMKQPYLAIMEENANGDFSAKEIEVASQTGMAPY